MISTAERHLATYPNARASTLARLLKVDAKCAQIARENLAREEKRVDDAMRACMKTFAINVWAAEARGALGGGA